MTANRKPHAKKGLLPKLRAFVDALGDRYHRALQVIDEALASDNLKDKIWAVDLILKRTPATESESSLKAAAQANHNNEPLSTEALTALDDAELMARIRGYLKDWEP